MTDEFASLRKIATDPLRDLSNAEAEQSLLGALMIDNRVWEHVDGIVTADDFANAVHGRIFNAISHLIGNGAEADPVALKHHFEKDGSLVTVGGAQYLGRLIQATVSLRNAPYYARTIADLARRRDIVVAAQDIITDAANLAVDRDAATVIDDAEQQLYEIAECTARQGTPRALSEVVGDVLNEIEASYKRGGAATVDTGISDLDRLISGMGAGELVVLAARPSMGKSALAGTIAMNCARCGKRVAIFSLEMTSSELTQRWIAGFTGIDTDRQRHGRVNREDWDRLADAIQLMRTLPIVVDDQSRLSVPQIRQRSRRIRRRGGLHLIIVDHLQLIRQGGKQEARRLEIGDATSSLKAVAKELAVPVLLLSQLSRAVEQREDKRPMLSDLRESGDIEQDADVVMMLYSEEYYLTRNPQPPQKVGEKKQQFDSRMEEYNDQLAKAKGLAEIAIAKNRHGRTGTVQLAWLPERQRFEGVVHNG